MGRRTFIQFHRAGRGGTWFVACEMSGQIYRSLDCFNVLGGEVRGWVEEEGGDWRVGGRE